MILHRRIYLLGFIFLTFSCAQIKQPQGGPADETPPSIVEGEDTTPNGQVFFNEREINLEFDEWITVSNTVKEIFVSPPLDYPLVVTNRGKRVIMEFGEEEVLKENTTYQINLGKSIKDLTAGNPLENYSFLFSTGAQLDELSIMGDVVDYESQEGVADIIVMLYDNLSDTVFTSTKPRYLTRTDKDGKFKLEYLRADTFQIFALKDENVSYYYDNQSELVGYLDSFLILESIDTLRDIRLELFDEEDEPGLIEAREERKGLVKIVYIPSLHGPNVEMISGIDSLSFFELEKDTLFYWHNDMASDSLLLHISNELVSDTVKVRRAKKNIVEVPLECKTKKLELMANDTIFLEWNKPLKNLPTPLDTNLFFIKDTSQTFAIIDFGVSKKQLWLTADLKPNHSYDMTIDSAYVADWYGAQNKDSIVVSINTLDEESLGAIKLTIEKEDSLSYLMEVRLSEEIVDKRTILSGEEVNLSKMKAGSYKVYLIQDMNRDGRWTSGDVTEKRRPEAKAEVTLEGLKAGWEIEATINITELFYATEGN